MNRKCPSDRVVLLTIAFFGALMLGQVSAMDTETAKAGSDLDAQAEMMRLLEIAQQGKAAVHDVDGTLDLTGHPAIGKTDAPLVMVELGSYQCGFCRKHFLDTMPTIKSAYVDTGMLRYVFFDFALDPRHEQAAKAAEAAHCAHEQGRYWEFRGQLYRNSKSLAEMFLPAHAKAVGLDITAFENCLSSGTHAARPARDRSLSRELKVRGTPSFFIGRPQGGGGQIILVKRISGARTMDFFAKQLDPLYAPLPRQQEVVSQMRGAK